MFTRIAKAVLVVALLSAFAAGSAPAFSRRGDGDFCWPTGEPTNCLRRADGGCYTQKCDDPLFNCYYSVCLHGK